jgi:hypothetical protein
MRFPLLALLCCALAPIAACGPSTGDELGGDELDEGGANYDGVAVHVESAEVTIDDEFGTDVRVSIRLEHQNGPAAETFEVVSARLRLDLDPYADIDLAIPSDHTPFSGLAEGEEFNASLRGSIPDNHSDWGLCDDPQGDDSPRVALDLRLRVTPGANDDEDTFDLESLAVTVHCSHTG